MSENKTAIQQILSGELPEVPFTVTVDDQSIIRMSVAAIIVVTICVLLSQLIQSYKK